MYENIISDLQAQNRTYTPYDILHAMMAERDHNAIWETFNSGRYFDVILGECGKLAAKSHWCFEAPNADQRAKRTFAQKVADLHFWVATQESGDIASSDSSYYKSTETLRRNAIQAAYPKLDKRDIECVLEILLDCNESVQYCVERYFEDKMFMTDEYIMKVVTQHFDLLVQYGPIVFN